MFNRAHIPETHYDFNASLQLMGNKESIVRELALMLKDQLPTLNLQLQTAFKNNDTQAIQYAAHKIHGGIAYVISPRLKYLISQLETACKQYPDNIRLIFPYIGSSIDDLLAALTDTFDEKNQV